MPSQRSDVPRNTASMHAEGSPSCASAAATSMGQAVPATTDASPAARLEIAHRRSTTNPGSPHVGRWGLLLVRWSSCIAGWTRSGATVRSPGWHLEEDALQVLQRSNHVDGGLRRNEGRGRSCHATKTVVVVSAMAAVPDVAFVSDDCDTMESHSRWFRSIPERRGGSGPPRRGTTAIPRSTWLRAFGA
jgi:hypothetical protein